MGVWIAKIFRSLFLLLDRIVYWAVNMVYQLFMMLSETGVFTQDTIQKFAGRIYVFLGVFMLFKVSFSLITYILNPDDLTDKGKGVNKLLTNFFVVLIGIIAVPYVFQAAFSLQAIVLKDNIVGNIILGTVSGGSNKAVSYIEQGGQNMSFTTLSAFLRLNPDVVGEECSSLPIENGEVSSNCEDASVLQTESESGNGTVESILKTAYNDSNIYALLDGGVANLRVNDKNGAETWLFEYNFLISTIAGGFLAWILLIFCFDVATRSVKLGFLQLIAPVPIISYVDPKSGKDGMFKKWVKECTSTYISLFGRLVAIYFAVFVISEIATTKPYNIRTGLDQTNIFVKVFIIFGALMFAKQLPELISNITGFKLAGGFTLNPMNKLQQVPLVGAGTTNLLGRSAGAIEAMMHDQTGNKGKAALSGWFGAGNALHGKVPLMGAKPGSQTVRSIHTGREAGYEVATGSKMRSHIPLSAHFRKDGQEQIDNLKKNYRAPLQQELNNLNLQKQETANAYNNLNESLTKATSEEERAAIRTKMQQAQARYQELSVQEAKVSGDISTINDQIKDLERAYDIDKSPANKMEEIKTKVDTGSFHSEFEPIDYSVPTSGRSSSSSSGSSTVGGVNVSSPNSSGERRTDSGIILPSSVGTDNNKK